MAINPVSGSSPTPEFLSSLTAQPAAQTASNTPAVLTPEQLSAEAADVLLTAMNANSSASTSGDSLLSMLDSSGTASAFDSLTGASTSTGDPLLDDLNAMDAGLQSGSTSSVDGSLSQGLNSFLLQQATASFQASQAMDNQSSSSSSGGNVLGNTTA